MGQFKDYSQFKIGKIQPLRIAYIERKPTYTITYWLCQCDCGNYKIINTSNLRSAQKNNRNLSCGKCHAKAKDLTGQTFGKLKVKKRDNTYIPSKENNWKSKWICECECGNIISVFTSNLTSLHTTSCGCINYSIGEKNIEQVLKENNINFQKEFSFEDLKNNKKLRFDFAIFDKQGNLYELIEFDGRQHNNIYTPWDSNETMQDRQFRDNLKNEYCLKNNIKLIRIPYNYRDKITIQLLELEKLL